MNAEEVIARMIAVALVPLAWWLLAHYLAKWIKPWIPEGPIKDRLYR